jgi:hypothetical protein
VDPDPESDETISKKTQVSIRTTRSAADPLNLKQRDKRKRNFFSYRVVEDWNMVPGDIKKSENSEQF